MKITKIALRDFRGFAGPEDYTIDLSKASNLLLYGENGSGKSSLFEAIRGLFKHEYPAIFSHELANVFTETEDGYVRVDVDGAKVGEYRWDYGEFPLGSKVIEDSQFLDIARRAVFLDYRTLLQTHNVSRDELKINIFDLLVTKLLPNIDLGDGNTVSTHWTSLCTQPPKDLNSDEREDGFADIKVAAKKFRSLLDALLHTPTATQPSLEAETNRFLEILAPNLQISLKVGDKLENTVRKPGESWTVFEDRFVELTAEFAAYKIESPASFLNEARLTAVALALCLASAKLNRPAATDGKTLRLLVLDDVLIGLDLAHRLPLLKLLAKEFSDWQVLLFTYDQTWFEMARQNVDASLWTICELYCEQRTGEQFERPVIRMGGVDGFLKRATEHLQAKDLRAAAVYARAAFEDKLRQFCSDKSVSIPFKVNPSQVDGDMFLTATEARLKNQGLWDIYGTQFHRLRMVRKVILNPLSHSNMVNLVAPEVDEAIEAVSNFALTPPEAVPQRETAKNVLAKSLQATLAAVGARTGYDPAKLNDEDVSVAIGFVEKLQFDFKSERNLKPAIQLARELTAGSETPETKLQLAAALHVAFEASLYQIAKRKKILIPLNRSAESLKTADLWEQVKTLKILQSKEGLEFQKQIEPAIHQKILLTDLDQDFIKSLKWDDFKAVLNTIEATKPELKTNFRTKLDDFAD